MSPIDDEWTADEENVFAPGGPQEVEIVYFDLDAIMRRLEAE